MNLEERLVALQVSMDNNAGELKGLIAQMAAVARELDETAPSPAMETPWMDIAEAELGVKEVNGKGHNPRILEYLQSTTIGSWGAGRDETAWCSAFVNWVMEQAGIEGTNSAMARSWLKWGREIDEPVEGCIVVLKRGTGSSGHVGFYKGNGSINVMLLGGNQSDSVCVKTYSLKDILGYRLPA